MLRKLSPLVLVVACSSRANLEADPDARRLLPRDVGVFVTESSSSLDSGAIEVIVPGTHRRVEVSGFAVSTDMQLRVLSDPRDGRERIFTVQSDQGVVVERDREARDLARFVAYDQGMPPHRANPLDVALANDGSLWIARHGVPSLLVIDEKGGRSTVDLSSFADDDGNPDMSAVAIDGDTAYVALRRLHKGFAVEHTSIVVAVDTRTRVASKFLDLPAKNPWNELKRYGDELWVSCIGGPLSGNRDAALVRIDLRTKTAKALLAPAVAGGFVTAFTLVENVGYAIVASFEKDNATSVVRFDPSADKVEPAWASTAGYKLWDVAAVGDLLLVADRRDDAPGLRVLSRRDGSRLGHIPTRLPPVEVAILRSPTS